MVFIGYLVAFAVAANAKPLLERAATTTTYQVSDVLNVLSDPVQVSTPSPFCSSLLKLSPATVLATTTKTDRAYVTYTTETVTSSTKIVTVDTYTVTQTEVPQATNSDVTITATTYVTAGAKLARRGATPPALKSFPATLVSSACSAYVTDTATVTQYTQERFTPTIISTRTKAVRVYTTTSGSTTVTVTATAATLVNYSTPTITATVNLAPGQAAPTTYPGNDIFKYQACQQDGNGPGRRALAVFGGADATPETCLSSLCNGFRYAGLEYGGECWCGNTIDNGNVAVDASDCSQTCSQDSSELCGNGNRLTLYHSDAVIPPNPYKPVKPTAWKYKGCYAEPKSTERALKFLFPDDDLTPAKCLATCEANGYTRAGVEYGRECYCDNDITYGAKKQADSACSFHCPGAAEISCGGSLLFNYYTRS